MTKRIILLIIFILFFSPQPSHPAWYFSAENMQAMTQLPDGRYDFLLEDLQCNVSKINFHRVSERETVEFRTLGCALSKDFYVEVSVTCNLPSHEGNSLFIRAREREYNPSLICAPPK
jgi:hypothetical protein